MKIGLITHHWVPNFGANLQALASYRYLQQLGHEVKVIDYQPIDFLSFMKQKVSVDQFKVHEDFLLSHFTLTKTIHRQTELQSVLKEENFDIVLSGSDALLRINIHKKREDLNFPNPFWMDWTFDKELNIKQRRFISVSNMGSDYLELDEEVRNGMSQLLGKVGTISVRDSWTKKSLLDLNNDIEVHEHVDPVFMLNDLVDDKENTSQNQPYILMSLYKKTVSKRWLEQFVARAHKDQIQVIYLPHPEGTLIDDSVFDNTISLPLDPLKWNSLIKNAEGYVGVRFHPIIICLANDVPFISLDTYQTSILKPGKSKTYDICKKLDAASYCYGKLKRKLMPASIAYNQLKSRKRLARIKEMKSTVRLEVQKLQSYLKSSIESVN